MNKCRKSAVLAAAICAVAGTVAGGAGHEPSPGTVVRGPSNTVVAVDAVQAPVSGASRELASTESGYTFLESALVAQTPAGFGVWVDPKAAHHYAIGVSAAATVRALRALGTQVRYRGYGSPAAAEGVIRMLEGRKGCGSGGGTLGMTWTYWNTLSSGKRYVTRADVYLCPRLFGMPTWATQATVGHELGHAMGLGHTNSRYLGSYQLMNAVVRASVRAYRSGDKRGLARLAQGTAVLKPQIPPIGRLDGSAFESDGSISFTGWALLRFYRADPVTILLTDNGRLVGTSGTPVLRTDVNRSHDPGVRTHGYRLAVAWNGGTHNYCITARAARHPSASAELGCITWHD